MPKKGVVSTQRIERLARVAKLDRQGYNQYQIAKKVGVSQAQVNKDLKRIQAEYIKSAVHDRTKQIAKMERQYDDMLIECWKAYKRSKQDTTKVVEKVQPVMRKDADGNPTGDGTMEVVEVSTTTEGRLPGVEYLSMIERILKAKRDLHGLDMPKKMEVKTLSIDFKELMEEAERQKQLTGPKHIEQELEQLIQEIPNLPQIPGPTPSQPQAQTNDGNGRLPNGFKELE